MTLKKIYIALAATALLSSGVYAQSAYDAYSIVPSQLRGTARFVGMAGAFTSLGGDLSCMTQNPAGLGLYRSSDIGLSFSINPMSFKTAPTGGLTTKENRTRVTFDNLGYVGVAQFDKDTFKALQWGVSYNRIAAYDRVVAGYTPRTQGSLTNYIASFTQGVNSNDLVEGHNYDPYYDSDQDWLSVLAYNAFMINNNGSDTDYAGLYRSGSSVGDALYHQRERGYTDEYNISAACNLSDKVFLGIAVGIYDMSRTIDSYYSESLSDARIFNPANGATTTGNAGFDLTNHQSVSGSGANFKVGVVVRPIDMLRFGLAVHTPTYMHLDHNGYADVDYNYTPNQTNDTRSGSYGTPAYDYSSRLNTPWRLMAGASAMIAGTAVVSLDYERVAYPDMKLKQQAYYYYDYDYGYDWNFGGGYTDNKLANSDVKSYFQAANIVRVGAEVRVAPWFTARAGYSWQGSAVKDSAYKGGREIYTSGTNPAYAFNADTNTVTLGVGFKYKAWYADLAYKYSRRTGTFRAYTPSPEQGYSPSASLTDVNNGIVISTGFRF